MSALITNAAEEPIIQVLLKQAIESPSAPRIGAELKARLQLQIEIALEPIEDSALCEMLRTVLEGILIVFDLLAIIESKLSELDTLAESLSLLEVVQFEIRQQIEFIDTRVMQMNGVSAMLRETFGGISYGMSHDVKRVFERELTSELRAQTIPVVYGKILHAHGLLSNCFQQTAITLLQILNPELDALNLFNDFEERRRQSLVLCNDLSSLVRVVRSAQEEPTPEALHAVVEKVLEFRDGSMQYLMYRDWRGYEQHGLALVTAIESDFDSKDLLHQFGCYVEVLYGHVKMRATLKDMFPNTD